MTHESVNAPFLKIDVAFVVRHTTRFCLFKEKNHFISISLHLPLKQIVDHHKYGICKKQEVITVTEEAEHFSLFLNKY